MNSQESKGLASNPVVDKLKIPEDFQFINDAPATIDLLHNLLHVFRY